MKTNVKLLIFSAALVVACSGSRLTRDPATGVFRDESTGQCFVYQAVGAQAWTVDVPCRGSVR